MEKQQLFETEPARWELKRLERQGKYISVMIDSEEVIKFIRVGPMT